MSVWTPIGDPSASWAQSDEEPYVELDYWDEGYAVADLVDWDAIPDPSSIWNVLTT